MNGAGRGWEGCAVQSLLSAAVTSGRFPPSALAQGHQLGRNPDQRVTKPQLLHFLPPLTTSAAHSIKISRKATTMSASSPHYPWCLHRSGTRWGHSKCPSSFLQLLHINQSTVWQAGARLGLGPFRPFFTLQLRKGRLREVKRLAQGHTAGNRVDIWT